MSELYCAAMYFGSTVMPSTLVEAKFPKSAADQLMFMS
jgi:hypothetical protein